MIFTLKCLLFITFKQWFNIEQNIFWNVEFGYKFSVVNLQELMLTWLNFYSNLFYKSAHPNNFYPQKVLLMYNVDNIKYIFLTDPSPQLNNFTIKIFRLNCRNLYFYPSDIFSPTPLFADVGMTPHSIGEELPLSILYEALKGFTSRL